MKKIIIIFITIFLTSCSSNDDAKTATIKGKWYPRESLYNGVSIIYDDHEPCGKDYTEFYGTNSVKSVDVFYCEPEVDWIGTYTKKGNNIIITVDGESRNFEIIELTNSSLSIHYQIDFDGDGDLDDCVNIFDR